MWAVERRENLLEDQSVLDEAKRGTASVTKLYDYYLGYLKDPSITPHIQPVPDASVPFAKRWGMAVAVGDLHRVIERARSLGGRVVLGGHSLGGGVVTAYATWNFAGKPGADQLSGLVYIDGGSFGTAESAAAARAALDGLNAPGTSPWDAFGGIPAPYAGLFSSVGALAALIAPRAPSLGQSSGLLTTFGLTPTVPVDNLAQFGYALNVGSSPPALIAAQAHLGAGITASGALRGWNGAGALTPIRRYATMMSGAGVANADGSEWYFPARLTLDVAGVGNGTRVTGPAGARPSLHARPPAPPLAADLRLRSPARRRRDPRGDPSAGPAVRDPIQPPDADRPSRVLRPQRSRRRLPPQRLLLPPGDVPAHGRALTPVRRARWRIVLTT